MEFYTKPRLAFNLIALAITTAYPMSLMAEEVAQTIKQKAQQVTTTEATANEQLPEVEVKAGAVPVADGYQATKTRVGKTLQDPHDVPQAVTTITRSLMHDQQVGSLREALRNVSGLTFNAAEGGRSGDNINLRGFYTFGDIYLDGIRDTAQYNRETFNLEQIDVLRGSAAMLFGRGQAGGVINQVSKTPQLNDKNTVTASVGEQGYKQFTGDFNKQLNDTTAIRLNVMQRGEENWRENPTTGDRPEQNRQGIAGSIGFGINTDDELLLSRIFTKTRDVPDYGVSFNNGNGNNTATNTRRPTDNFSSSSFYGTDNNFDDSETTISTATYTHKFNKDMQWRTQVRVADYERQYWAKTPSNLLAPSANGSVGGNQTRTSDYDTKTIQSDFSNTFNLFEMKHQALAGFEFLHEESYRTTLRQLNARTGQPFTQTGAALTAAIAADGVTYNKDVISTAAPNTFTGNSTSFYAQDTIEFIPKWDVLFGIRRDELRASYSSTTSPSLSFGENSYRTGLSYHYNPDTHYYLSYSDAFSPTADLYQLSGGASPPERGETTELGAKWMLLDGDLAFRTALYSTTKEYERNGDLDSTAAILTKKRRTNGLEFELAGRITSNWEIFSDLAFMDAKILETATNINAATGVVTVADPRFEGERARNTPTMTFNAFSTYKVTDKWRVGGGFESKGKRYGYNPTSAASATSVGNGPFRTGTFDPNTAPGYTRWDALVAYEEKKWAVRLNIKNVFDKVYYDSIYDNGPFTVPGNRRAAVLTTEFKF